MTDRPTAWGTARWGSEPWGGLVGSEELSSNFQVQQPGSSELSANFTIQNS